jgi:molybdopterin/thiamine biosynthesis adenylyltransferase
MNNTHEVANFSHQTDLFDPTTATKTVVFGAGSVGGYAVDFLAKMGVRQIVVWDDDVVDSHNCPMSIYSQEHIGRPKVEALQEIVLRNSGITIDIRKERYHGQEKLRNVSVLSCVDTMNDGREPIWKEVRLNPTVKLLCDTRTSRNYLEVLAIAPCDMQDILRYEALLFDDKDAERQSCGAHGTVILATRTANIAVANLATFWQTGRKTWRVAERCDTLERIF